MSGTFDTATESKAPSVDSISRPSFNLYWPSSVNFIEEDAPTDHAADITDTPDGPAKTGEEAESEHEPAAECPLPQTQTNEAPELTSQREYSQLGNGEIRLLKLHRGDYDEDLLCELQNAELSSQSKPDYEALSYTWADNTGDKTESEHIWIIHMSWTDRLRITRNCANALRRLRYLDRTRTLWVDSICINQRNVEERSHQVSKMRDITI
uniref:Ankyrin and het domain protein n=1 Tax=Colletotrichum fructicola (strain Nara gc5) TaxID=1213859 RepID=L2FFF1_COLFN